MKVLFIAKNIPTPLRRANDILFRIAERLDKKMDLEWIYPKAIIPFFLNWFKPYDEYGLKDWQAGKWRVSVVEYPRLPGKNNAYSLWKGISSKGVKKFQEDGPFDLIHAHFLLPDGVLAYKYWKRFATPYIVSMRNADMRFFEQSRKGSPDHKLLLKILKNAAAVQTLNHSYAAFLKNEYAIEATIVPHAIDESDLAPENISLVDEVRISCVSTFDPDKNIDWVIDAIKDYKGDKKIKLDIIGDGPLNDELRARARGEDRIYFAGRMKREEVLEELSLSSIFVLPSCKESFGRVYLEAAARYNAVIAFKGEGIDGVLRRDNEAFFCANEEEMRTYLYRLIEDDVLRTELSNAAYKKAGKLTWEKVIEQYEALYQKALNAN